MARARSWQRPGAASPPAALARMAPAPTTRPRAMPGVPAPALARMALGLARKVEPTAPKRARTWTARAPPAVRGRPAEQARLRRPQPLPAWERHRPPRRRAAGRSPSAAGGVRRPRRRAAGPGGARSAWAPPCVGRADSLKVRVWCSSIETSFPASHAVVRSRGHAGTRASMARVAERSSMRTRAGAAEARPAEARAAHSSAERASRARSSARSLHTPNTAVRPGSLQPVDGNPSTGSRAGAVRRASS